MRTADTPGRNPVHDAPAAESAVERAALAASPFADLYPPRERLRTVVVDNFPALGRLAALRFLEWAQRTPGGVVSLPTGKTPEHFIKWVGRLLERWDAPEEQTLLREGGVDPSLRPDMRSLHFVQIDEFYPIDSAQQNSFYWYVRKYYLDGFGLDPSKALLIDCNRIGLREGETLERIWPGGEVDLTLRYRAPVSALEETQQRVLARIDQWTQEYEERIRALGGIGFFLGGIGPDGHVGFNVRGSDHYSTTRLTPTNYETQAAAATDLGGIEVSRRRLVITIGLGTITVNPDCVAVLIAAGEAKAGVVRDAVESPPDILVPATALHRLSAARLFVTEGAATSLGERRRARLAARDLVPDEEVERIVTDLAVLRNRPLAELTREDFEADPDARLLLERRAEPPRELAERTRLSLVEKIDRGLELDGGRCYLHTEPHHDDIMLGYLPAVVRRIRDASATHHFATLTSGFTSVTNAFMLMQVRVLEGFMRTPDFAALWAEGYFDPEDDTARDRDVWQYLDGVAAANEGMKDEGIARRFLRDVIEVWRPGDLPALRGKLAELADYFSTAYPGKKDTPELQRLKGMSREWESECLWGYFGWDCQNIHHLRLGFYTGDIFTEEPEMDRDVRPVHALFRKTRPDVVTLALDPEASGPDTHYKVMQAVTEALRIHAEETGSADIRVWGYRNVWYRFHPAEANVFIPVSLNMFSILRSAFLNAFLTQKEASFPSYELDGPFCDLAQKIQVEQYQRVKTCLGREWFHEHPSALIRATRGFVFLRQMDLAELTTRSRELRRATENR